jgi:uncharacterized membrane protein YfcA
VAPPELLALALAAFVGSSAQSATGFGVLLLLAPLSFALQDVSSALLTITIAASGNNLLVVATRRRSLKLCKVDASLLIASAIPGLVVGALIVSHLSKSTMQVAVGASLILAVAARTHQPDRATRLDNMPSGAVIGLLAGTLTTTVGLNGPPMVIWLRARRATLEQVRDTLAIVFLSLNIAAIPALVGHGATTSSTTLTAVALGLVGGHVAGMIASTRATAETLERAILVLIWSAASGSIAAGIATTL